ncbi:Autonomous transposable element EN-1 mosaic protein [Bienertia sinuspersici]
MILKRRMKIDLKEENMPNFVDKKDWEWLVKYFGSEEFQKKSQRNIKNRSCLDAGHTAGSKSFAQKAEDMYKRDKVMPGLLDVYEETHLTSDKLPVTQMASDALDPLNAPLYEVEQFSQIPQENKDKMWQLVLDKFDIGLDDDQEEEERKKKYMRRRKFIMESLNKKYRNFRARLKSDYYDTEETDEDRLKEENMPNFVDKKDWEWLVKYFGSEEFQYKRDKVMPGLLDVYEETHLTSNKLPVTQMASDALNEMKRLLEQRKAGEISLTDEEIYAKIKPKGKRNSRDRHTGVSPSITSLFGGFSECEKLRKEADKAMNEAAEAKKEAISANEQNKILTKKLKDVERENKVTRHFLEKFLNTIGYNLSDFNMDEDFEESNEEYDNEEDKDEEEISGNDRRLE